MDAGSDQLTPIPEFKTIGVVGAGQMGTGIAQITLAAGYSVKLLDVHSAALDKAIDKIRVFLDRRVSKGDMTAEESTKALEQLEASSDYGMFSDCDLIIEAASEDEEVKKVVFEQVLASVRPDTILASNTSSISITRMAAASDRPERFVGIHFMNPVPAMKLVELIRGIATDEETFNCAKSFVENLGKKAVSAEDFPAFIVNRILLPMINEAVYTLYEGVGTVESIDSAMRLGANHPMGPLELADFIGLDTCLAVMQVLYEGLADTKYRPCPLLVKYVEAGWHGRKSGRGFYDYRGETPVPTR